MVVQVAVNERAREPSPMPVRIALGVLLVLTAAANATSIGLVAYSVHEYAQASPNARLSDVALWTTCVAAGWFVAKPCLAVVATRSHYSQASRYGAGAVWLVLLAYNWAFVSMAVVPWHDGVNANDLCIAANVLVLEIISSSMPAVLCTRAVNVAKDVSPAGQTASGEVAEAPSPGFPEPADPDRDEEGDHAPSSRRRQISRRFSSISDLLRDLEAHGVDAYPMLKVDEARRLIASQREIARALGGKSPATVNAWLTKEKARGLIDFKVSTMFTMVWLVPGSKHPTAVHAPPDGTLNLDLRAG